MTVQPDGGLLMRCRSSESLEARVIMRVYLQAVAVRCAAREPSDFCTMWCSR